MDTSVLNSYKDSQVVRHFVKKDNLPILESIIFREAIELLVPISLSKPEKALTKGEFKEIQPRVVKDVNEFLRIGGKERIPSIFYSGINPENLIVLPTLIFSSETILRGINQFLENPAAGLFSLGTGSLLLFTSKMAYDLINSTHYNGLMDLVFINSGKKADVSVKFAHEYAHHIQSLTMGTPFFHKAFREGHARGVERHIAELYAEREGNSDYLVEQKSRALMDMNEGSKWLKEVLEKGDSFRGISQHALGTSLFGIMEERYGKELYSDILSFNKPLDYFVEEAEKRGSEMKVEMNLSGS